MNDAMQTVDSAFGLDEWLGRLRFYNLLVGMDDGVTWRLYTYKDGYLSISPKPWSPTDLPAA